MPKKNLRNCLALCIITVPDFHFLPRNFHMHLTMVSQRGVASYGFPLFSANIYGSSLDWLEQLEGG